MTMRPKLPSPNLNSAARTNLRRLSWYLSGEPYPAILNLGCGRRLIGWEALTSLPAKHILSFDLFAHPAVDVRGDAHELPFRDECFHAVVSQAVLEHTRNPFRVAEEIGRIVKPGGYVYVETPFLQGYHSDPDDYFRFTLPGLREVLSSFTPLETGVCVGPGSALSGILREFLPALATFGRGTGKIHKGIFYLFGWLTLPIKYLDRWPTANPKASGIASGYFFLGRKR